LGERFTSKSGLVDGDVDGLGKTAVGGNNVTNFEGDHVTRDQGGGFDFAPLTSAADFSLGRERIHEGLDGVTGVALLVETDGGIDEEQEDDTDEILPIRGLALTIGEGDGDEGGSLHDPGEGIPHKGKELRGSLDRRVIVRSRDGIAHLEKGVLFLDLELIGAEKLETALGLLYGETVLVALEELEDVVDDDGLKVNLFLIIQVLRLELNLGESQGRVSDRTRSYARCPCRRGPLRRGVRINADEIKKKNLLVGPSCSWPKSLYSRFLFSGSSVGDCGPGSFSTLLLMLENAAGSRGEDREMARGE